MAEKTKKRVALSIDDLVDRWNISRSTIVNLIRSGDLIAHNFSPSKNKVPKNSLWRVWEDDAEKYEQGNRNASSPRPPKKKKATIGGGKDFLEGI